MNEYPSMKWVTTTSDGTRKCSECGELIAVGAEVKTRFGNEISPEVYPKDPTSFCVPCVTPVDFPELEKTEPGERAREIAEDVLGVVSPEELMLGEEASVRRVAKVIQLALSGQRPPLLNGVRYPEKYHLLVDLTNVPRWARDQICELVDSTERIG